MSHSVPSISVAIPFAGGPIEYFHSACNSLRNQDVLGWNAVVVDDTPAGSVDVASAINRWKDPRITYRRNRGLHGIGNAWNACMEEGDGELVCLLHADDELETNYLSTMVQLAQSHPEASLYFCGATIIGADGDECFSLVDRVKDFIRAKDEPIVLRGQSAVVRLVVGNFIMCPTVMYRRSRITGLQFSDQHRFVLDLRFNLAVLFGGGSIVGTQRKLYRYRRHEAQATAVLSSTGQRFAEELQLFREIGDSASARGWQRVAIAARARPLFRIHAALARKWNYVFA